MRILLLLAALLLLGCQKTIHEARSPAAAEAPQASQL
jgi:hypothetical protein